MDYSKTINLPKTDFSMKADLAKKEPEILNFWERENIYQKVLDKREKNNSFVLHDGPPYANAHIHIGHALNKILKDFIVKFKSMQGYYSCFVPGWDCHGLPIEYQLLKDLKLKKGQVSPSDFRIKAADYVNKFVEIQKQEFKQLGVFGLWDKPYLTMFREYEGEIIDLFQKLVEHNYIYRGRKPVYWCPNCETALAEAEVEYNICDSDSIYVKFPAVENQNINAVIWTTTPWTLISNVAISFHPNYQYSWVKYSKDNITQTLIIASDLVNYLMDKFGIEKWTVEKVVKGKEMEGMKFFHPFLSRQSVGVLADFVGLDEGTGIVHIAPGHGMEDFIVGQKYNLELISPVDDRGKFNAESPAFQGENVFDANDKIISLLAEQGKLLIAEKIQHQYPYCWRCKKPIIFRTTEQWFLDIDKNQLRQKVLKNVEKVRWIPDYGENRIKGMIENRPDWCLSRQRLWGTPIPVVYCQNCGNPILDIRIIENVKQKIKKEGSNIWFINPVEDFLVEGLKCPVCKGNIFRKENDILDVWFDSGASFYAVLKKRKELSCPADLYLEGSDQHRGWFQSSLINSVIVDGQAPYRTVLTHGFVVDGEGKKMSKSLGNVISPQEIIKRYGVDILRLWVASENYTEDIKLSQEIIGQIVDAYRKMRNTIRYLLGNISDFVPQEKIPYSQMQEIDQLILHRLQILIEEVEDAYNNFEFFRVFRKIYNFCVIDLSSFYLDVLKDRLYTFHKNSIENLSARTALYEIADVVIKLLAPIISYTAEEAWRYLPGKKEESVFLSNFPHSNPDYKNEQLSNKWEKILEIRQQVYPLLQKKRIEGVIGSSLEAKVILKAPPQLYQFLNENHQHLIETFIVSQVEIIQISDKENSSLLIEIQPAAGQKCIRCWNYSESVGKDEQHPQLCSRCLKTIKKWYI